MPTARRHRLRIVWTTIMAMVFAVLAPTLARAAAIAYADAEPWAVVCSTKA